MLDWNRRQQRDWNRRQQRERSPAGGVSVPSVDSCSNQRVDNMLVDLARSGTRRKQLPIFQSVRSCFRHVPNLTNWTPLCGGALTRSASERTSCVNPSLALRVTVFQCSPVFSSVLQCSPVFSSVLQCFPVFSGVFRQSGAVQLSSFRGRITRPHTVTRRWDRVDSNRRERLIAFKPDDRNSRFKAETTEKAGRGVFLHPPA